MSSTNRGYERHKSDYYATPIKPIIEFFKEFRLKNNINLDNLKWLDPCAGGDKDKNCAYPEVIDNLFLNSNIKTIDIREDSKAQIKGNFLEMQIQEKFDFVISNPPFYLAQEFIEKSLLHIKEEGFVVMLLRLNFFGSKKRKPLFEKNMPSECFVHHQRISFNNGGRDSIEYAHFVWRKENKKGFCKTYII